MLKSALTFLSAAILTGLLSGAVLAQDDSTKPATLENDYLVGTWTAEGIVNGAQLKGTMRVRTGADNTCLILNWTLRGEGDTPLVGTALAGRDPKTNRFTEYCFESTGSHFVNRYEIKDNAPELGIGHGKRTGVIKGKEYKGDITVDRQSKDRFVYTVTSAKGEDGKLVFKRAKGVRAKRGKTTK